MTSHPTQHSAALVMAAGFSKRFGQDKRLHPLPTISSRPTILEASLSHVIESYDTVAVVLRNSDKNSPLVEQLSSLPVKIIYAPENPIGLGESIATGVKALQHSDSISICLGDMPFISPAIHQNLLQHSSHKQIVRPSFNGTPGHPVIFGKQFFSTLMNLHGDQGAMSIVKANQRSLITVDIPDQGVIRDIDHTEDLKLN